MTVQVARCTPCDQHTILLEPVGSRGVASSPQGSPLSTDLIGGEVRGPSSLAVSVVAEDTAAAQAGKEQPSQGVQKTHGRVGKNSSQAVSQLLPA